MTQALTTYTSLEETMSLGDLLAKSGFFPDSRSAAQAVVKVLAGREIGFGPIASMTGINVIQGKVGIGANLIAAAIKRSGKYDYRVKTMTNDRCEIDFRERTGDKWEVIGNSVFTKEDATAAGTKNMEKFARNMLFARAMSNGARWFTPDIFGGPIYTPEELGATVDGETGEVIDMPPARVVTVEKPSAGPTWTPSPQDAANDAAFEQLPSASQERNGANGKTTPASAHDPAAPWDDNRKAEAVRWAMRRYPEVYNHVKPWQLSLDHLLEKAASEGMDAAQIAQAWKDKCAAKQDELDAKKLQATLDAQAAGEEKPQF